MGGGRVSVILTPNASKFRLNRLQGFDHNGGTWSIHHQSLSQMKEKETDSLVSEGQGFL